MVNEGLAKLETEIESDLIVPYIWHDQHGPFQLLQPWKNPKYTSSLSLLIIPLIMQSINQCIFELLAQWFIITHFRFPKVVRTIIWRSSCTSCLPRRQPKYIERLPKKVNHRIISIMKIDSFYWISSNSIVSIVFTNFLIKNLTLKRTYKI